MWHQYLTIPNIIFGVGLLILLAANGLIILSALTGGWDGLGFGLVWYFTMIIAGFPLVTLFFKVFSPRTNSPKPKSKIAELLILLLINILFIAQWLIWRFLLRISFY